MLLARAAGHGVWWSILLHVLSHSSTVQADAQIVQPPTTQVILPGTTATFNCITNTGVSQWTINGTAVPYNNEGQSPGITATAIENIDPISMNSMTNLTLNIEGLAIYNGSQIQCYTFYGNVYTSDPVYLIIAGAPLAPNFALKVVNSTVLQLSWNKPFTWTVVADILNYTVSMYNSSSQEWKNWTVGPLVNTFTIDRRGVAEECAELLFEVSAANVVGESQSYSVSGGFPTVMKWADLNGTTRLAVSLLYNKDGRVLTTVRVQPPLMCSYQTAQYAVTISDFHAGMQLALTSVAHTYGSGDPFDVALMFTPREEVTYSVILSVSCFDFPTLPAIASFNVSPTFIPTAPNFSSGVDYGLIIGVTVGATAFAIVLVTVFVITVIAIWCRFKKEKMYESEAVVDHHRYQKDPVTSSNSFQQQSALPDPVYERIDECVIAITTDESKEYGHLIPKAVSVNGAATDNVRHTPDGDTYIEMNAAAEPAENSSCSEVHVPGGPVQNTL